MQSLLILCIKIFFFKESVITDSLIDIMGVSMLSARLGAPTYMK